MADPQQAMSTLDSAAVSSSDASIPPLITSTQLQLSVLQEVTAAPVSRVAQLVLIPP